MKKRRNADDKLRKTKRASGEDDESAARYLLELVRAGKVSEAALKLAAQAGFAPALLVHPNMAQLSWEDNVGREKLLRGLEKIKGKEVVVLLACDFAEHALPQFEELYPEDDIPRMALLKARQALAGKKNLRLEAMETAVWQAGRLREVEAQAATGAIGSVFRSLTALSAAKWAGTAAEWAATRMEPDQTLGFDPKIYQWQLEKFLVTLLDPK